MPRSMNGGRKPASRPACVVALAASLRRGSINERLLEACCLRLERIGAAVERVDYRALCNDLPDYDQDIEDVEGLPAAAMALGRQIEAADGILIASPEFNHSMPGTLKNVIDWLSRIKPVPLEGKVACIVSASPSMVGGYRGLQALRLPLEALDALVLPSMYALAQVRTGDEVDAALAGQPASQRLEKLVIEFVRIATGLRRSQSLGKHLSGDTP